MSFKLALRNVQKNLHDYLIYFLTLMLSVSLFYAFNSIQSQPAFSSMNATKGMLANQLGVFITLLSNLIAVVLAFLIVYANQFLLKRRKKELGIYMTLGMSKGKISRIFVGESFLIGLLALTAGLALGFVLSQGLSLVSLKLFAVELSDFQIVFSLSALRKTALCFVLIFVLVMLCNVWTVSSVKLIDLLNAGRKNESLKVKNLAIYIGLLVISIACIGLAGYLFSKYGIMPTGDYFNIAILALTIGTALLFYSLSAVLMAAVKSKKSLYLKGLNTFLLRQIGSKIQSNFLSMTVVCALLTATICIISTGMSIALTMNSHAQASAPYDMTIVTTIEKAGDTDLYTDTINQGVPLDKYVSQYTQIANYSSDWTYQDTFLGKDVSLWHIDEAIPETAMPIISISDFNKAMELQGKSPVTLNEGEFLLNCNYQGTKDVMGEFLDESGKVVLNGISLTAAQHTLSSETIMMTSVDNNDRGTLIVPDSVIPALEKEYNILSAIYKESTEPDEVVTNLIPLTVNLNSGYRYTTKSMMYDMYYGTQALVAFICCYIGFVFLLICVAMLALQQLTETADNIYRYGLLQKLGVDNAMMQQTLFKQIGIYFITPLLVASVFSAFGIKKVMELLLEFLNMQVSTNVIFTVVLFLLVYGGYFIATYLSCKRMVQEQTD